MAMRGLARRVGITGLGEGEPSGWMGMPPEQARAEALATGGATAPFTGLYQQRYGIPVVGGEVQGYILDPYGKFRDAEGNLITYTDESGRERPFDPATQKNVDRQKARNIRQLLDLGIRPQRISDQERLYLQLSEEEMKGIGYVWDEEQQNWIAGEILEEAPQSYGAAAPYPGYGGYGYGYQPRYGGGGGGYGYPVYGGGGGGVEINFPEGGRSFVEQQRRGQTPQQRRNQAARFGAVTWRI